MRHLALTTVFAALVAASAGATTISTLPDENSFIVPWGLPDTAAYGQSFTLSAGASVNGRTFRINDQGSAISYLAKLFAWDGFNIVGSELSSVGGSTAGLDAMTGITASLGNVLVAAGQYVAFFQATSAGSSTWGSTTSTNYAGGAFVFQNNGGDESLFGTAGWNTDWQGQGSYLALSVNYDFAAIPLPASLPLLLLGLGGMAALRHRKAAA